MVDRPRAKLPKYQQRKSFNSAKKQRAKSICAKQIRLDDSYILDRLNLDNIDFHMNRPGYEEKNFEIIMKVLAYHYPSEDLSWMRQYQQDYLNLLV